MKPIVQTEIDAIFYSRGMKKNITTKKGMSKSKMIVMRTFGGIFIAAEKHVNKIGKKIKTSAKQEAA